VYEDKSHSICSPSPVSIPDSLTFGAAVFPAVAATRLFIEWKVFEHIPTTGSITYADLAAKVDADTSLISKTTW